MKNMISLLNNPQSTLHRSACVCLILLAIGLRLICFQGYSDSDPRAYSVLADDLAHGIMHIPTYDGPPVFPLRLGVYGPTALLIKVFGLSELTLVAYPFFISIIGCLLAYTIARRLYYPLAGLISMGILAVLPFDVTTASILFPDAIAAFWANIGILFILISLSKSSLRYFSAYALFGGIFIGVSWLCKESVVYLAPFIGILCFQSKTIMGKITTVTWVGIGALAILTIEILYYQFVTGDPLFRVHATERNYIQAAVWFFDQSSPYFGWEEGGYAKALIKRLFINGPDSILHLFSTLPALAALAVAWGIVFRYRTFLVPGMWFVTLMLMFNFMSSSFHTYRPLPLFERYLYPLLLPSVLLFAGLIATHFLVKNEDGTHKERQFWAWVLIGVFSAVSVPGVIANYRWSIKPEQLERIVASKLTEKDIIYTDYRTASSLVFFRTNSLHQFTATTIPYENLMVNDMINCSYVLVDKGMTKFLTDSYKYKQPLFVDSTPETWRSMWTKENAVLFQIGGEFCKQDSADKFKR